MIGILSLIFAIALVGVVLYLIETFLPMDAQVKKLLVVVVIIVLILWVLSSLGLLAGLGNVGIK